MTTRTTAFRELHNGDELFVMPNPFDVGSARILERSGFKALATSSGGMAYARAKRDGAITKDEALEHCRDIVDATHLPVSADLERGFGDSPEDVFKTVIDACQVGLAGCSIEDYNGNPECPLYDETLAIERVQAAVEACRSVSPDFVFTARCENLVWGQPDLDLVIRRLQAYADVGADVLFAPGLSTTAEIETVVSSVSKPLNVVASSLSQGVTVAELSGIGVTRVSTGSALAQLAYAPVVSAVAEMKEKGAFGFINQMLNWEELESYFD